MGIEQLPASLLKGKHLHCRPVENGPIVTAQIIPADTEITPMSRVVIVCAARKPSSKCAVRMNAKSKNTFCQYYKGDSCGEYQIIGPGMDHKTEY